MPANVEYLHQKMSGTVYLGDSLEVLRSLPDESVDLIYVDPPFGTQAIQRLKTLKSTKASKGTTGFGGHKYAHTVMSDMAFSDIHDDFIKDFLAPNLTEAHRVLKRTGTLYLHMDWHHSHYAKVFLDALFGRECFLNHIVWCYNWGGRGKRCWPKKHDDILVYVKTEGEHVFNWDAIDKIPYKAPELQKDETRAAAGQVPPDWWDMQIIGTGSSERTGYPTQKPLKLVERIIRASSNPGDVVLDFCVGSGTTCVAAHRLDRRFIGIDCSEEAMNVIRSRFASYGVSDVEWKTHIVSPKKEDTKTYGVYISTGNWACENGGDDIIGTFQEMDEKRKVWQKEIVHPQDVTYEVREYTGPDRKTQ